MGGYCYMVTASLMGALLVRKPLDLQVSKVVVHQHSQKSFVKSLKLDLFVLQ